MNPITSSAEVTLRLVQLLAAFALLVLLLCELGRRLPSMLMGRVLR